MGENASRLGMYRKYVFLRRCKWKVPAWTATSTATILAQEGNAAGLGAIGGQGAELRGALAEDVHASAPRVPHQDAADFAFERPLVRLRLGLKAGEHVFADATDGDCRTMPFGVPLRSD